MDENWTTASNAHIKEHRELSLALGRQENATASKRVMVMDEATMKSVDETLRGILALKSNEILTAHAIGPQVINAVNKNNETLTRDNKSDNKIYKMQYPRTEGGWLNQFND